VRLTFTFYTADGCGTSLLWRTINYNLCILFALGWQCLYWVGSTGNKDGEENPLDQLSHNFFAVSEGLLHVFQLQDSPPQQLKHNMQQASQIHWNFSRKSKFGVTLVSVI
jgi:hypothetical protein